MNSKSDSLFHFTKNIKRLQQILKNGFWPRYCAEDISWAAQPEIEFVAYPMVCFCDIPLSRIDEHVRFYGNFGLGLTREWAIRNGLNPVFYIAGSNDLGRAIQKLIKQAEELDGEQREQSFSTWRAITSHIKPTEGKMIVSGEPVEKNFYRESEWRYIPSSPNILDHLSMNTFNEDGSLDGANANTRTHCMLQFTPQDVRYIFVRSDSEIPEIMNFIQSSLDSFPHADLKILMSRVTSLESIRSDL